MSDQMDLWDRPVTAPAVERRPDAPVLVVEERGHVVVLRVEGQPPRRYGPGLGRKPRMAP